MHSILSTQRRQSRRIALLTAVSLVATLFTAGCAGDSGSSTGPKANADAGVYSLRLIDGANLPVEVYHGPYFDSAKPHFYNQMVVKALKGSFDLQPDGSYTFGAVFSTLGDGTQGTLSWSSEGEYEIDGDEITFEDNTGFSMYATIEDGEISITFNSPLPEDKRTNTYTLLR